jgi:peptide/nickel transport system permease protein
VPLVVRYLIRRLLAVPVTLLVVTAVLYAILMQTPPEVRAQLYLSPTERQRGNLLQLIPQAIERHGLNDPYPVQYGRWLGNLVRGNWNYSPSLQADVLPGLLARTPVTAELALSTLLVFVPLGILAGALAASRQGRAPDHAFRAVAFAAPAIPPFVLGLVLLVVFYTGLRWFPPGRLSLPAQVVVQSPAFRTNTGLLTLDGLLNGRPDVALDAARHLVLPVATLAITHWATLGRLTRASLLAELRRDYATAARAHGVPPGRVLWRHAFPNAAGPAFASSTLAAASLLTGVFVVEIIFDLHGVSEVVVSWLRSPLASMRILDLPAVMGFAVYSVLVVQALMLGLDLVQAALDPRFRAGLVEGE